MKKNFHSPLISMPDAINLLISIFNKINSPNH